MTQAATAPAVVRKTYLLVLSDNQITSLSKVRLTDEEFEQMMVLRAKIKSKGGACMCVEDGQQGVTEGQDALKNVARFIGLQR